MKIVGRDCRAKGEDKGAPQTRAPSFVDGSAASSPARRTPTAISTAATAIKMIPR